MTPRVAKRLPKTAAMLAVCFLIPQLELVGLDATGTRKIQERFMAPCCWSQSVAVHDSPVARAMRDEIATLVSQGKSEEEIVDYYVGRYGERILSEPRGQAWIWLNAVPIGVLSAGLAGLLLFLARARRSAKAGLALPGIEPDVALPFE